MVPFLKIKKDSKIQREDQKGSSLRKGFRRIYGSGMGRVVGREISRRPYSGIRDSVMATPAAPNLAEHQNHPGSGATQELSRHEG